MTRNTLKSQYFGFSKFSYIPEGLVSHIASAPGQLCRTCSTLDFPSYFVARTSQQGEDLIYDGEHALGTYDQILCKALTCEFCQLVVEALANGAKGMDQMDPRFTVNRQSIKIYLNRSLAGIYRDRLTIPDDTDAEPSKPLHVGCMVVYSDLKYPEATRAKQRDRGFIRLLANDAHLLGEEPMYHGRIVGNHVSPNLLRTWIKTCENHHTFCNDIRSSWGLEHLAGPRSLRYIDTQKMRLRYRHWYELADHVALSYVWGGSQGLQLLKSNEKLLFTEGALTTAWSSIPAVIQDAIELVRDLNVDDDSPKIYLWVDQLCIVQDDPKDKAIQIAQMNQTYSRAIATLIAAEGSHSDFPLTRRNCHTVSLYPPCTVPDPSQGDGPPESSFVAGPPIPSPMGGSKQMVKNIQGLRLVVALPTASDAVLHAKWNTRAWTMQEAELSHSSIIFGEDQVIFRCAQDVFREDFVAEITPEGYKEIQATGQAWFNSQAFERKLAPADQKEWPLTLSMYSRIVEEYTQRAMTFRTDILPAFQGVAQVLHALCGWKIMNGLIEDVIDYALLWRPLSDIKRRFGRNGDPDQKLQHEGEAASYLPTYSWCAWLGPVTYRPQSLEIRSLIHRFEIVGPGNKNRRLVRFSQNVESGIFDPPTLEPKSPYAPQDCSDFEDVKQTMYWFKPQAQNLAYRWHLANSVHKQNVDGPCILQFTTKCARLRLLTSEIAADKDHAERSEGYRRAWLLNDQRLKVGTAWYVPMLDDYNGSQVDVILLSKNKSESEAADGWQFDRKAGAWDEWCLCNVMLIKRLPELGLSERLTIGKIHVRSVDNGWEEMIRLV
ncbi:MAG: hypothetical protein Q9181_007242 [Wetmoreana brouardii]